MGFAYLSVHGKVYSGNNIDNLPEFLASPYNFLSVDRQLLYNTKVPFSMTMLTLDPKAAKPYHLTVISPNYYLYIELTKDEYELQVLNRGQHLHNTFEIVYTRNGDFFQQIEARRYKYTARSCCILNRNIRHTEEYTGAFSTVTLSLTAEFLRDLFADPYDSYFPESTSSWQQNEELKQFFSAELQENDLARKTYLNFVPIYEMTDDNDEIHAVFDKLAEYIIVPAPGCSFLFRGLVCKMLDQLSNRDRYSTDLINLGTEAESEAFSKITQLMEETHGRISRSELTQKLSYSGHYLNRVTQKYTGMSIFKYGSYFTMKHAAWLLTHSDLTISEIATELGFTDRTHFYQLFRKEFDETPKQYRQKHRH